MIYRINAKETSLDKDCRHTDKEIFHYSIIPKTVCLMKENTRGAAISYFVAVFPISEC